MKDSQETLKLVVAFAVIGLASLAFGQDQQADSFAASEQLQLAQAYAAQLAEIEENRSAFVANVLAPWREGFGDGGEEMEQYLMTAPAERILAASAAEDFGAFREAALSPPNVIGDLDSDLVFYPVAPCRLFDTRSSASGILVANVVQSFRVNGDMSTQGGDAGGCGIPTDPSAVVFNLAAVTPTGAGNIRAFAYLDPVPTAAVHNYNTGNTNPALSNMITVPVCDICGPDISLRSDVSNVHAVGDIVGYYDAPNATALETTTVTQSVANLANGSQWNLLASCPTGYSMTGGGFDSSWVSSGNNYNLFESGPEGNGWRCRGYNATGVTVLQTYCRAVCARIPGN